MQALVPFAKQFTRCTCITFRVFSMVGRRIYYLQNTLYTARMRFYEFSGVQERASTIRKMNSKPGQADQSFLKCRNTQLALATSCQCSYIVYRDQYDDIVLSIRQPAAGEKILGIQNCVSLRFWCFQSSKISLNSSKNH